MQKHYLLLSFIFCFYTRFSFSQCASAVNGNTYDVVDTSDSGWGTLRQAIIDANTDNVGGVINVLTAYQFSISLYSPLPNVTCDSLAINFYTNIVTGNLIVPDPPISITAPHSCMGTDVLFVDFVGTNHIVINTNDSGAGSLREAIALCNLSRSYDYISFNIPGPSPHLIQPLTPLPTFYGPVEIDGSTQPANGYNGSAPKIELDGTVSGGYGLDFKIGPFTFLYPHYGAKVYGMFIHNFSYAIYTGFPSTAMGLTQFNCGGPGKGNVLSGNAYGGYFLQDSLLIIENNYFGTDTSGAASLSNGTGVEIESTTQGAHIIRNNVFSGNGIGLNIPFGDNFFVRNNLFGTDMTGTYAIPNTINAINSYASNVIIGGINSGDGNLFSGNYSPNGDGIISCNSFPHVIQGNKFGTNLAGTDTIPNHNGPAINIYLAPGSLIGGPFANARNIISATIGDAIKVESSKNSTVQNNYIGTDITGSTLFPNSVGVGIFWICDNDSINILNNLIAGNGYGIAMGFGCNVGHRILNNVIRNNGTGIFNGQNNALFSLNSIYNNNNGIFNCCNANDSIQPPVISFSTPDSVTGTSLSNATIELYYSESLNYTPQGKDYIATVMGDSTGHWKYTGTITDVLKITATQTDNNKNTSEFSQLWSQVAPDVWPGDCNYDLTVDNYDFLYLNIATGDTGTTRSNASINWVSQSATDWNISFASGVNHKHADTNGDGVVNLQDTIAIIQNYGYTHPFRIQQTTQQNTIPDFYFVANLDTVAPGSIVTFQIYSGTSAVPIDSIYGLGYSLLFENYLVDTTQISFDYTNSALGIIHSNIESFEKTFYTNGQIDAALCRTNHTDTSNIYGLLGSLQIKTASNISSTSVLHLNPSIMRGITFSENPVVFNLIGDSVVIAPSFVGINNFDKTENVNIYPNPAKNFIDISYSLKENKSTAFILYNSFSQKVKSKYLFSNSKTQSIDTTDLPNGIYFWELKSIDKNISNGKLVILK